MSEQQEKPEQSECSSRENEEQVANRAENQGEGMRSKRALRIPTLDEDGEALNSYQAVTEQVKSGPIRAVSLEEVSPEPAISGVSPVKLDRSRSVSLRAPTPPRRISRAAPAHEARAPEAPEPAFIAVPVEPQLAPDPSFERIDQGSLMPVSWEKEGSAYERKRRSPSMMAPPVPARASRSPQRPELGTMPALALSNEVPHPLGVIERPSKERSFPGWLLPAAAVLLIGTCFTLTYSLARDSVPQQASLSAPDKNADVKAKPRPVSDTPLQLTQAEPVIAKEVSDKDNPVALQPRKSASTSSQSTKQKAFPAKSANRAKPAVRRAPVPAPTSSPTAVANPAPVDEGPKKFDVKALKSGVRDVMAQIGTCRSPSDPSGVSHLVLVFAPSGRVTSATVSGAPFAGTPTGGCIARRFRALRVPPFEGAHRTIRKTVVVQ